MAGSLGRAFRAMFGKDDAAPKPDGREPKADGKDVPKKAKAGPRKKKAKGKRATPPAPLPAAALHDDMENVELALALARAEAILDEPKRLPQGDSPLKSDLTRALEAEATRGGDAGAKAAALLKQIESGGAAPAPATPPASADAEPADREALIAQALAIQREKAKMISRLPREARERLLVMANHAFGGGKPR
ncbi:MAG: hypothetical protein WD270_06820 [Acetobacterales bacterium]